ncbi:hypothetical protein GOC91_23830 [Sinorhizobium medicae]|uniref:Uncharacterized protein n=1 Tax=Sinorhizobium medicae (strain WSM419) TaxID=366394 RepID=A6UA75_SINMW|nr:hypothetical protein Smed_1720 [Sinorhizobium medicae WSM419]MDX0406600.1 hypothetical protein [Sinorhizobium medicae]MDX0413151.1 hypothetical protein [Sinorhizobium medicae]MDX0418952.1 hypothetical protein [Sinorhizobium medicae]MDX0425213.1 hypothetical protein [Sinorhizobium medicae]
MGAVMCAAFAGFGVSGHNKEEEPCVAPDGKDEGSVGNGAG